MTKKTRIISSVVCILIWLSACQEEETKPIPQALPEVKVSTPYIKEIVEWDEYTGRFRATKEVDMRARVSGYLEAVKFKDGQMVNKDDVLFVIDQRPFKIALKSAEAQYSLAKKELERAQKLRKTGAVSQGALDRNAQEMQIKEADLEKARLDMAFTEVKSPLTGRISRDLVNEGNLVNGSDANATILTSIVSVDPIHFYFEASERELLKYTRQDQSGQRSKPWTRDTPVEVQLQDEKGFIHKGTMDFVDNRIDRSTGSIEGRALIPNPNGVIQPGMFGRARLLGSGQYEAILVPDVLIGSDQSRKFLYVLNEKNQVEMRVVTLGAVYQEKWRIIRDGLKANDRIVAKSIQRVRPGMTVTPKEVDLLAEYQ